ncbi:MAG TPA: FtsW/RodA/SpoVE family cell cycle protein [Jatrophihabitans sp.]|jgi:cell division protein FtsI/penicillin-binding protein 2/cell division protein FtsW (lipid II flippase)
MLSGERSAQPAGSGRSRQSGTRPVERKRPRPDVIAVLALATLVTLGLLNLQALGARSLMEHQAATVFAGFVLFVIVRRFRAADLRWLGWLCYAVSVLLLVAVGVAGDVSYGARRWLTFGSFTLQPSELAKVGLLLVLADVLGREHGWLRRLATALLVAAIPVGLVVMEPDLSTASVLAALTVAMLVLGRIPLRVIVGLTLVIAIAAPFAEKLLHPYQLERLHAYFSGSRSASGAGWTILQAHIALAWGGLTGAARDPTQQVLSQYLPARETDLAFASLVEQWGIIAGLLAVLAAGLLVWRFALASRRARTPGAAFFSAGFAALIGIEVLISVAANLGLIPTAGVPFPLLSYGGTAAAAHLAMAGMVLRLRSEAEWHRLWMAPSWRRMHPRMPRFTAVAMCAGLLAMAGFAINLQQSRGNALRASGLMQMIRCTPVAAPRGVITDRHGTPIAVNVAQDHVWIAPGIADDVSVTRVAALVSRPPVQIQKRLAHRTGPFIDVATVPLDVGARIRAARLHGVLVVRTARRHYPFGALVGPLLGWTGVATPDDLKRWHDLQGYQTVGRAGLEQMYDPLLRGRDGQKCVYVDPAGQPVAMAPSKRAVPGSTVRLTLDMKLQRHLTGYLAAASHTGSDLGGAVMLDPRNGQVLAMASLPSYDNNIFGPPVDTKALARLDRRPGHPGLEHVTQVAGPPGSTFKLVVASANMVHRVVPPHRVVPTGGAWTLGGHTFHNWSVLPPQDLTQAIAWSNDVYFYKLAWALGAAPIIKAAHQLGVGRPTGIDLPGESGGYLGTPSTVSQVGADWYPGSTVLLGIGQGYITTTPLQDAVWTAGVSTGAVVTPHLGLGYESGRGTFTRLPFPAPRRLPFASKLGPVRAGMRAAVTGGTAGPLSTLPVAAGGKTGTAEDSTAPGAGNDSWLSAVAPMHRPVIEATAFLHGGGAGEISTEPVRAALAYFLAHQKAILAGPPVKHHR